MSRNMLSALVTSLALASFALPAFGKSPGELTPDNFDSEVATGHWFIEHYSPYCGHCTAFAPTWEKLVQEAETELPGVNLAQVNCILHGDLCDKNGVAAYPTLLMFEDGKIIEKYKGSRKLEDLKKFLKRHVDEDEDDDHHDHDHHEAPTTPASQTTLNPNGEVSVLDSKSFDSTLLRGPTFVKFYAPWCGHCKKLAPVWKQLAKELQGKVQVTEVNCDVEVGICKNQNIQGYPTLVYFSNGVISEYQGGRKLEQLKAFGEKATAETVQFISQPVDLEKHVREENVVYLLIYTSTDRDILKIVRQDSAVLLGSPFIYASPSPILRAKYNIPKDVPWALLALKDHDSSTPASTLLASPTSTRDHLKDWFLRNRLPSHLELTRDAFQSVMNAPHNPLVVIAASNQKLKKDIEETIREVAAKWRQRTDGTGRVGGKDRDVVWTVMDGERWKDWMKSMYGIGIDEDEDDLDDVKVVIANHKDLVYYDQDRGGKSFKLTSHERIFKSLEDIVSGKLGYKNSENIVERLARHLNNKMLAVEAYVVEYPFRFVFFLVSGLCFVFFVLFKWVGNDAAALERGEHVNYKSKTGRID